MQKEVYEFISKKLHDPIVEWRICKASKRLFAIFQTDIDFYHKVGPTINGTKYPCLHPVLAPDERRRLKLSFRNNKKLYKRTCDWSGDQIISMYKPSSPYTVYHQDVRYTDVRDPLEYGQDIDRERPFFDQMQDLLLRVPKMALTNVRTENSQYANYISDAKNCYMSSIVYSDCENIYYSFWILQHCRDLSDSYHCYRSQLSIGCTNCSSIFDSYYLHACTDTRSSYFSTYLQNCDHCIFCNNLVNQQYCIHNKQVTKLEFNEYLQKLKGDINFFKVGHQKFQEILQMSIVPGLSMVQSEASLGNDLWRCKNTLMCSGGDNLEDCRYMRGDNAKDCWDISGGGDISFSLESINVGLPGTSHLIGCTSILHCHHMYYCDNCYDNCSYCFGCVGLRGKQYCIFNKQYDKETYFNTIERLIQKMIVEGVWGHFFPPQLSAFAYNETRAGEIYPLSKKEALEKEYTRYDEEIKTHDMPGYIPLHISQYQTEEVGEVQADKNAKELLASVIVCEISKRPFRITHAELELYKKLSVPIPTIHPDERYKELSQRRAVDFKFYIRHCAKTGEEILSAYPSLEGASTGMKKEKVYSQKVFDEMMYG